MVVVIEDHSLLDQNRELNNPCDLIFAEELLHNHMQFGEPQTEYNETFNKIYNMEAETLDQKTIFVEGLTLEMVLLEPIGIQL